MYWTIFNIRILFCIFDIIHLLQVMYFDKNIKYSLLGAKYLWPEVGAMGENKIKENRTRNVVEGTLFHYNYKFMFIIYFLIEVIFYF